MQKALCQKRCAIFWAKIFICAILSAFSISEGGIYLDISFKGHRLVAIILPASFPLFATLFPSCLTRWCVRLVSYSCMLKNRTSLLFFLCGRCQCGFQIASALWKHWSRHKGKTHCDFAFQQCNLMRRGRRAHTI